MVKKIAFILLMLVTPAFGIELDADNNDAVDIGMGGTNAKTAAQARERLGITSISVMPECAANQVPKMGQSGWGCSSDIGAVQSVNALTGAVSLTTDTIPEGSTNQYFSDAKVEAAAIMSTVIKTGDVATLKQLTIQDLTDTETCPQWQWGEQNAAVNTDLFTLKPPCTFAATTITLPEIPGEAMVKVTAPTTAADTCTAGAISWADGFIYVCIATDTWQRAAIATWQ